MQPVVRNVEFLVGTVTHRHRERPEIGHVVEAARLSGTEVEPCPLSPPPWRPDGPPGRDASPHSPRARRRWPSTTRPRVATAPSSRCTRREAGCRGIATRPTEFVESIRDEVDVAAPTVTAGATAHDDADALQHIEVVGQQVRRYAQLALQLPGANDQTSSGDRRRPSAPDHRVPRDDRLAPRASAHPPRHHVTQSNLRQLLLSRCPRHSDGQPRRSARSGNTCVRNQVGSVAFI